MDIKAVVNRFAERLRALIDEDAMERARVAVLDAFGMPARRGPGRPAKAVSARPTIKVERRKLPRQLCPVPGCKNPAAPIFGMVCAKHKGVAKSKIRKYREARRAKKLGLKVPARNSSRKRAKKSKQTNPAAIAKTVTAPAPSP